MSRIVLLSHCLLNPLSQVRSPREREDKSPLIEWFLAHDVGMVQLPCPETELYGLRRWGHCREQFDHPHYRRHCDQLVQHTHDLVQTYLDAGHEVLAVVGIDGSPSCGVNFTCSAETWGGEISAIGDLPALLSRIGYIDRSGVYMETLREGVHRADTRIPFLGYRRGMIPQLIDALTALL